jgi:hypothetical protein
MRSMMTLVLRCTTSVRRGLRFGWVRSWFQRSPDRPARARQQAARERPRLGLQSLEDRFSP